MAIITPSALISEIRGSVGDTVYSHNRYRAYTKLRTAPSFPGSDAQLQFNAALSDSVQGWRNLTDNERESWIEFAKENKARPRIGDSSVLSGMNAYIRASIQNSTITGAAPRRPSPKVPWPITTISNIDTTAFQLLVNLSLSSYSLNWYNEWWFSKPSSPGIMSPNSVNFKFLDRSVMNDARINLDLLSAYEGRFALSLSDFENFKIFWYFKLIDISNGVSLKIASGSSVITT
jgi:hypothetical protein